MDKQTWINILMQTLPSIMMVAVPVASALVIALTGYGIKYLRAHTKNAALDSMLTTLESELTKHVNDLSEKETKELREIVQSDKPITPEKLQEIKTKLIANSEGEAKKLISGMVTPGNIITVLRKVI